MKLSNFLNQFYDYSGKASDSSRQLAFAGIAIAWIFKQDSNGHLILDRPLLCAIALFAISLGSDLLQYFVSSIIWGIFHRSHEKKLAGKNSDPEIKAAPILNKPGYVFYFVKVTTVLMGYGFIIAYLFKTLGAS